MLEQTRARKGDLLGQLSSPLRAYLRTESGSAGLLLFAAVVALCWANSPMSAGYQALWATDLRIVVDDASLGMDLRHWVNDGLMVLFFFVIGLEVRHEVSVGQLTRPRRAILPLVAALGGMIVPAGLYLLLNPAGPAVAGWGVVIGTDTAFMLGALALVGPAVATQLRIFLLTLTVVDDIVAVSVIGAVYTDHLDPAYLALAAAGLAGIAALNHAGT